MIGNHVYPQGYRGFESLSLRKVSLEENASSATRLQNLSKNFGDGTIVEQRNGALAGLGRQMHVALLRAEVDVSGELLDGLRGRAAHGEMAAEGVAQHVRPASLAGRAAVAHRPAIAKGAGSGRRAADRLDS